MHLINFNFIVATRKQTGSLPNPVRSYAQLDDNDDIEVIQEKRPMPKLPSVVGYFFLSD